MGQVVTTLQSCEKREEKGFVLGIYNFSVLMDFLRELDLDEPIEIGLSAESQGGRARMLKICHGDSKIYLAGMTQFPKASSEEPEPDAFSKLEEECKFLRDRVTELEMRSGGMV